MSLLTKINNAFVKVAEKMNLCSKKITYVLDTEIPTGDIWIDGKEIYKYVHQFSLKNITISAAHYKFTVTSIAHLNIQDVVKIYCVWNENMTQFGMGIGGLAYAYPEIFIDDNNIVYRYDQTNAYHNFNLNIFIEYTKA